MSVSDDVQSLEEIIEDLFPLETEDAYINWNGIRIALNYKYDVSTILQDALSMLEDLLSHNTGDRLVSWPSISFRATWHLRWSQGQLLVEASWEQVCGNLMPILAEIGPVQIQVDAFVAEWMELVNLLAERLISARAGVSTSRRRA